MPYDPRVTIVLAGGSGFLGRNLAGRLLSEGHKVLTFTRRAKSASDVQWDPNGSAGDLPAHLEGVDAVVNLAGEGIADRRWTEARKQTMKSSRLLSTRTLVRAVAACSRPPRVLINASAVGYYGPRGAETVTEATPPGSDFLATLCVDWEEEARRAESPATRVAVVRSGLVLDRNGGALARMWLPFKLGLGATLGSGDQFMPWIHVKDWTAMVSWLIQNDRASGAFNATAPAPVTNRTFTRSLGLALHRPAVFHAPAFALQALMGEMSSMLLTGQRAIPAAAEQQGFRFTHRTLESALRDL
jgi:uncharacterized protein (TIGR01777 family)